MKSAACTAIICTIHFATYSTNAFANTLVCTLSSSAKSEFVSLDLSNAKISENGQYGKRGVFDLNFYLSASCKDKNCHGSVTIDSGTTEEQVSHIDFKFSKTHEKSVATRDSLTNAPDRREYDILCEYVP